MSSDIVDELRQTADESENDFYRGWVAELLRRAADEIERVRRELDSLKVLF